MEWYSKHLFCSTVRTAKFFLMRRKGVMLCTSSAFSLSRTQTSSNTDSYAKLISFPTYMTLIGSETQMVFTQIKSNFCKPSQDKNDTYDHSYYNCKMYTLYTVLHLDTIFTLNAWVYTNHRKIYA